MKKEWKWLAGFGFVSILLVGVISGFRFHAIEIQLHDSYYVTNAFTLIIHLTLILWFVKNLYLLVDLLTDRYKIIALLISIILPIILLLGVIILQMTIQSLTTIKQGYPDTNVIERLASPIAIGAALIFLTVIEIKSLSRTWKLISKDTTGKKSR